MRNHRIPRSDANYIEPGPFWWALDHRSAVLRGARDASAIDSPAAEPNAVENAMRHRYKAVLAISNIERLPSGEVESFVNVVRNPTLNIRETGAIVMLSLIHI